MSNELPPLPKPDRPNIWSGSYSPEAMRDYAAAAVAAERERCAHVCAGIAAGYAGEARRLTGQHATHAAGRRDGANGCAAAIYKGAP